MKRITSVLLVTLAVTQGCTSIDTIWGSAPQEVPPVEPAKVSKLPPSPPAPRPTPPPPPRLVLSVAHSEVGPVEYERFVLTADDELWRECGRYFSKSQRPNSGKVREGDEVFPPSEHLKPAMRTVSVINKALSAQIRRLVQQTSEQSKPLGPLEGCVKPSYASLCSGDSPNQLATVPFEKLRGGTSLASEQPKEQLKELLQTMRGKGSQLCERRTFFGLP